jgi:hypothetical protein
MGTGVYITGGVLSTLIAVQCYRKLILKKGVLTNDRRERFDAAMNCTDENHILTLATEFDKVGLKKEARTLRKRVAQRHLPEPVKQARRKAFKRAFKSHKPEAIMKLATAFEQSGAVDAASKLRVYAETLTEADDYGNHAS